MTTLSTSILGWILLLPLATAILLGLLHLSAPTAGHVREGRYAVIGIAGPLLSALLGLKVLATLWGAETPLRLHTHLFQWIAIGDFRIDVGLSADPLGTAMLFVVTVVGTLIHIYAAGYMKGDEGYGKFFAFFNFFMAAMLLLILADNPIMLFVGWELVGLASYLLIGYWFQDPANVHAANKAFWLNRVGDFGFVSGLALLFVTVGEGGFGFDALAAHLATVPAATLALIGALLFVGAMGKSAQIPLFVWLPDAMAGPTPVSALIHAATMVTAGVYMVARFAFLYDAIPQIGLFIASIGAASALLAALAASRQNDIKKILAYSTMSQLGYMFIAVGLGFYSDGIFHLFTHAFFKALLFMGAGAVILALHHEQNIFRMGSLRATMPLVSLLMLVATLAIVGIPPFAGFFSKDAILAHAFVSGHWVLWAIGVVTAFLTAFYMFRLYFVVFVAPSQTRHRPAPLPRSMTAPMVVLGLGAAFAGFLGLPEAYGGSNLFASFLALPAPEVHPSHATEYLLDGFNVLVGLAGIFLAYHLYVERIVREADPSRDFWSALFYRAFYLDALYETLVGGILRRLSRLGHWIDTRLLDGAIMLGVGAWHLAARGFAALQTGSLRWYVLVFLGGVAFLALYLMRMGGVR